MRDHTHCKYWTYETHPNRAIELPLRCRSLTASVLAGHTPIPGSGFDTRQDHKVMFEGMTPSTCTCIVGNYRGTGDCPDLTHCPVGVDDDHRLGFDPALVGIAMVDLEEQFVQVMDVYHVWLKGDGQSATPERQLKKFVVKAAYIFERFLTIHPYIDGNGHCARLMLFRMLTWAGFPPVQWDIDQKLPLYEQIKDHRKGQRGPLMVALTVFIASVL